MAPRVARPGDRAHQARPAAALHDDPARFVLARFGFELAAAAVLEVERLDVAEQSYGSPRARMTRIPVPRQQREFVPAFRRVQAGTTTAPQCLHFLAAC